MLTVKSGLDRHMIIELEDGIESCSLVMLAIGYACHMLMAYLLPCA
jgi:hypothetical protein